MTHTRKTEQAKKRKLKELKKYLVQTTSSMSRHSGAGSGYLYNVPNPGMLNTNKSVG